MEEETVFGIYIDAGRPILVANILEYGRAYAATEVTFVTRSHKHLKVFRYLGQKHRVGGVIAFFPMGVAEFREMSLELVFLVLWHLNAGQYPAMV